MATTVYQLLFAGPVGAGKTTAIQTLSDIQVVSTEALASDDVAKLKPTTTVAMDFGLMKLASGDQVRLYGAPGQKRFDFMWEILSENALGLVLLIDASAPDPLADLLTYVREFRPLIDRSALVVGITHGESGAQLRLREPLAQALSAQNLPPCVMDVDARDRTQMALLVRALIYSIDPFTGIDQARSTALAGG
jgi:signal recognition particle receptor subunit beta